MSVKYPLAPLSQVKDLTGVIKNPLCLEGSSGAGGETAACKFIATLHQHCGPHRHTKVKVGGKHH